MMKNFLVLTLGFLGQPSAFAEPLVKADLSDCHIQGLKECWSFADGVLTGTTVPGTKGSNLWTNAKFKNFTLKGEFRFSREIDSGIFLRVEGEEIQLGVSPSRKKDMTFSPWGSGEGYAMTAEVEGIHKPGDWNTFTLTVKGSHYLGILNGRKVLDYESKTAITEGPIGFQIHPGDRQKIEFRKLDVES